jgi:hypothetical protein
VNKLALIFVLGAALLVGMGVCSCTSSPKATSTIAITTTYLSDGELNIAYSQTLEATGGTGVYTWSITGGSLPTGLSLASSTGVISGISTTAGVSSFTARATDSNGATATEALSIDIDAAPSITTTSFQDGAVNDVYSQTLGASGGDGFYSWYIMSGTLPAGLTLDIETGIISGTPTTTGTSSFTIQVTDSNGLTASQAGSITIETSFSITTTSLPDGTVNNSYSQTLAASGGSGTYTTWTVNSGSLPAGLSLASSTGIISGTPTASGASSFTIQVTDSNGATATQALSINIAAASTTSASTTSTGS